MNHLYPYPPEYRVDKDVFFMDFAHASAKGGKCSRKKVGAVIVVGDAVASQGYNGAPRGTRHCDHSPQKDPLYIGDDPEHLIPGDMENGHCALAVHAEMNAIFNAARHGISVLGGTMYVTVMPCFRPCAPAIVNAGIRRIVFQEPYRPDERAFALYRAAGITVHRLNVEGDEPKLEVVSAPPWTAVIELTTSNTEPIPWIPYSYTTEL